MLFRLLQHIGYDNINLKNPCEPFQINCLREHPIVFMKLCRNVGDGPDKSISTLSLNDVEESLYYSMHSAANCVYFLENCLNTNGKFSQRTSLWI